MEVDERVHLLPEAEYHTNITNRMYQQDPTYPLEVKIRVVSCLRALETIRAFARLEIPSSATHTRSLVALDVTKLNCP